MAFSFAILPVELQRQCLNYLDTATLKSTRLVCRALQDIAAEALFGVATLQPTEQSADKFQGLIRHKAFQRYIRQINLGSQWIDDNNSDEGCWRPLSPEWWKERVAEWSSVHLPHLNKIVLDTAYACIGHHCSALGLALDTFLSLGAIDSLTIKHLQDDCETRRPDFAKLPVKLRELHLLITPWRDDACSESEIHLHHRHAFFNIQLNATWLEPLQSQLTHLTLHCQDYWGIYPRWQPGNLKFPHLKSLAFGNWTIAHDWQIDFITSHGATLEQLIFTRCPIMHAVRLTRRQEHNSWQERLPGTTRGRTPATNRFSDLRWHTLLPQLVSDLPKLTHFSMGRGPHDYDEDGNPTGWPSGHGYYGQPVTGHTRFEHRYSQNAIIDRSRYATFDGDCGTTEWEDANIERQGPRAIARGFGILSHERDKDWKRGVQFPDCLQEDQDALHEMLRTLRGRW